MRRWFLAGLVLLVAQPFLGADLETPGPAIESFREDLEVFFVRIREYSPTVLGELADDPEAMRIIRERISALEPEELEAMYEVFSAVPNWQAAPELLSASVPPEFRRPMTSLTDRVQDEAESLNGVRNDMAEALALGMLLPDGALTEASEDRLSLGEIQAGLQRMPLSPLKLFQDRALSQTDWLDRKQALFASLPPEFREGVEALARQGSLSQDDLIDLEVFRDELLDFMAAVDKLPLDVREQIDLGPIALRAKKLRSLTPEMLYVMRQSIDLPGLRRTQRNVDALAMASAPTEADLQKLEIFRSELLVALVSGVGSAGDATGDDAENPIVEAISGLSTQQLALAHVRLEDVPEWQTTLPALLTASRSPAVARDVQALRQGDDEMKRSVEAFRTRTLRSFDRLRSEPGVAPVLLNQASRFMREAPDEEILLYWRAMGGQDVSPNFPISAAVTLDSVELGEIGEFDIGSCSVTVDVPVIPTFTWDFGPVICNPIETVINSVIVDPLNFIIGSIETGINAVEDLANEALAAVSSLIGDLIDTLLDVTIFDGPPPFTLGDLIAGEFEAGAVALAGELGIPLDASFWETVDFNSFLLPDIGQACPNDGLSIPGFGVVGEASTAASYNNYKWLFDKLLELIPDTEISLTAKIPAQVLYGAAEFLGMCLDSAAASRDEAETQMFRADVEQNFATTHAKQNTTHLNQAGILSAITALSGQLGDAGAMLTDQISEVEALDIQLKIENNLIETAKGGDPIAMFFLPSANDGMLEVVREIVDLVIIRVEEAGEDSNNARMWFERGNEDFMDGAFKTAYSNYARAYKEVVKGP